MAKYDPLQYALRQTRNKTNQTYSFKQVEKIIGAKLPPSARLYPEWWANEDPTKTSKVQCLAWQRAHWKMASVNIDKESVTFVPLNRDVKMQNTKVSMQSDISASFAWQDYGNISLDHKNRLVFPAFIEQPNIYRIKIYNASKNTIYIGETNNMRRRAQGYRTPGPTQATNQRLNQKMCKSINSGYKISIALLAITEVSIDILTDLSQKHNRMFFEAAAISLAVSEGQLLLNK